jgi:hypothetical protein
MQLALTQSVLTAAKLSNDINALNPLLLAGMNKSWDWKHG